MTNERVVLDTPLKLLKYQHSIEVWCPRCKVWRAADLAGMVRAGRGDECLIGRTWRCQDCGEVGQAQLRPPVPGSPGYEPRNRLDGGA
jgi:hypothetical protein